MLAGVFQKAQFSVTKKHFGFDEGPKWIDNIKSLLKYLRTCGGRFGHVTETEEK